MEISDEVEDAAYEAWTNVYDGVSNNHRQALRDALQAAIPLVVEGLVVEASTPKINANSYDLGYQDGYNDCGKDILAKVKK